MRVHLKTPGNTGHIQQTARPQSRVPLTHVEQAKASEPVREVEPLLQLQQQYGNRYVQRVLAQAREEGASASPEAEQAIQQARGGGQALDSGVRAQMEPAFGADFRGVRVHTDAQADTLSQALNARAFTTNQDIFFRQGAYSPGSSNGRELLAHELTHVVQQTFRAPSSHEGVFREEAAGLPDASEASQRRAILDCMTSGMTIPDALRVQILDAMRAFSINQLETMQRRGVLLWGPTGVPPRFQLPPELVGQLAPLANPATYYPSLRLIRVRADLTVSPLRHELAHAWDFTRHLRGDGRRPIYRLLPAEQEERVRRDAASGRLLERPWSAGRQRHRILVGGSEERLTMEEMFDRYNRRLDTADLRPDIRNEVTFDTGAPPGHSRGSVWEFYAEGYNTFHGIDEIAQARLLNYAPELFSLLQSEAATEGLSAPDEGRLRTLIRHNCHIPSMRPRPVCP